MPALSKLHNSVPYLLAMALAGPVMAQDRPQPAAHPTEKSPQTDPGLSDPSIEEQINNRHQAHSPGQPLPPTPGKVAQSAVPSVPTPIFDAPGLSAKDGKLPVRRIYPEGSFMPVHAGNIIKARSGDLIFVPDSPGEGPDEPAMILMGCQRLAQVESAIAAPGFSGRATMSGQIFTYRDRHYLLPTAFSLQGDAPPATHEATTEPGAMPGADPRAEELIKELESQRTAPRGLDAKQPQPTEKQGEAKSNKPLLTEGTVLTMRRGRLIRQSDGRIAFAFDNDPNSPAPAPMILEPCAQLVQLEGLAATRGDNLAFKISGRVTVYQGRNYLLPTMHQVLVPGDIVPMQ